MGIGRDRGFRGERTVVLGRTVVTLVVAQLMALATGGMGMRKSSWKPAIKNSLSFIGIDYVLVDVLEMASMGSLGGAGRTGVERRQGQW